MIKIDGNSDKWKKAFSFPRFIHCRGDSQMRLLHIMPASKLYV